MAAAENRGSEVLIISHKLAPHGDNTVCAAYTVANRLISNGGKLSSRS